MRVATEWIGSQLLYLKTDTVRIGKKALFLDRDGVINYDIGYTNRKEDFILISRNIDEIKRNSRGRNVYIVTNQSGIYRGYYGWKEYIELTSWYLSILKEKGIDVRGIAASGENPKENGEALWRKPSSGMVDFICKRDEIDPKKSMMLGDRETDMIAGKRAGSQGYIL